MQRRTRWVLIVAAAVGLAWAALRLAPAPPVPMTASTPGSPSPSPPARSAPEPRTTSAGKPTVPVDVPTGEPGLDRDLARDYRKALEAQGIRVIALAITDRRKAGGARRADIVYQTKTDGKLPALRPEIARIAGPATSPRLALDIVTIRAARRTGAIAVAVSIGIPDVDLWLKAQISDDEFYRTWVVQTPPR